MKIGIDGRIFSKPGSGIVRYAFELTQTLIERHPEHDYYIYVYKNDNYKEKVKFKGRYHLRIVDWPKPLWRTKLFTDMLDRDGIDVYHSMHLIVPYVPSWMRKVAIIHTCHGINPDDQWTSLKDQLYWRPNLVAQAKFSDRIICVSNDTKKVIHEKYHVPLGRMDVGYVGIGEDMKPLPKGGREKALRYLNSKYKTGMNGFVLYVGGTLKNKNLPTVLKTWKILKEKGFKLPIVITRIGYGDINEQLEEAGLVKGKDVVAIPWVDWGDLPIFYSCATISIYPSLFEGFGWPIIESMACGTPVILSNISALPEAAGGAGILVNKPTNPNEWAGKISALCNDKKRRDALIKKGSKRVKMFSWDRIADDAVKTYIKASKEKAK
jgi:glycosyltransferase involved in cell wall biosynthesis